MLKNTFIHIPGVGFKTEQKIWENNIYSWDDFLERYKAVNLSSSILDKIIDYLSLSTNALAKKDIAFFANSLPKSEWWRLYPEFRDNVAFLDIETTGLSTFYDEVTLIGIFDGKDVKIYIKNQNLDDFRNEIQKYSMVVTYNGSLFDLPFLSLAFENLTLPAVHVDLRYLLRRLGYSGGLKTIEEKLGISRRKEVKDLDGFGATILWNKYIRGDAKALELLVKYNIEDTTNLKILLELGYKQMKERLRLYKSFRYEPISKKSVIEVRIDTIDDSNKRLILNDSIVHIDLNKNKGNKVNMNTLLSRLNKLNNFPKVIGIDLSSSETKSTGWALLKNDYTETKLLRTNKEIIELTTECQPDLISIDSPLSIPKGRDCLSDRCECRKFGIMRECERELKRRGINVFPCLLPSMQSLTQRGIELTREFRNLGFNVIESYPGAAQDILRIIRKKISIEELKQGLIDFGLKGRFLSKNITHDELDSITSALVGYFYLIGDYEALGNKEEGYLIIPTPRIKE